MRIITKSTGLFKASFDASPDLDFLFAYGDVWRAWEQRREFSLDISAGTTLGDATCACLWFQLVKTASHISHATLEVWWSIIAHQTIFAVLRFYRFNTRVTKMALEYLMAQCLASCVCLRLVYVGLSSRVVNLVTLELELETLVGQLAGLQIDIEQKATRLKRVILPMPLRRLLPHIICVFDYFEYSSLNDKQVGISILFLKNLYIFTHS